MNSTVHFSSTAAKALGDSAIGTAFPWQRHMEGPMKITDTVDQVLKNKSFNKILPISPEQSVHEALLLMAEYDVGALMVMSGMRLVGILSERDYARKGILVGNRSNDTKVWEIMTSPVVSVTPQHTVDDCMNLMTEGHFRHIPVLENDRVVGIVSIGDMVKWVMSGQEHDIQALEGYITGAYPG
ncbi:MAG: CBS domain-containing protein [Terracidiphilus sp.]|jgi:CBS domain-containing protein